MDVSVKVKKVETMENWRILEAAFKEKGWKLWQLQYRWDDPVGFHAWFWKTGKEDVELITKCEEIQSSIVAYNPSVTA